MADGAPAVELLVDPDPLAWPERILCCHIVESALSLAVRTSARPRQRKSKKAPAGDVLIKLLTAFASGGRRRSEVVALRIEDLVDEEPVHGDPQNSTSPLLPCLTINLGRTKTRAAEDRAHAILIGRPVEALKRWIE